MPSDQKYTDLQLAAEIIAAFVSTNTVDLPALCSLITEVHAALARARNGETGIAEPEPLAPAVSVKKSVTPDFIICLDDGKKFKSLKRHLTMLGMTPEEYRAKWNLPRDYPMVAPNYAKARSELALKAGLGRKPAVAPKPSKAKQSSKAAAGPKSSTAKRSSKSAAAPKSSTAKRSSKAAVAPKPSTAKRSSKKEAPVPA